jgi:hypothetical protein
MPILIELISSLGEQSLQLSPTQKQEVYGLLVRWLGQLVRQGPVPLSLDFLAVGRDIRYRSHLCFATVQESVQLYRLREAPKLSCRLASP